MSGSRPVFGKDLENTKKWIAVNGFNTADRIGDTTGVISVTKRTLQATGYIPKTDAINNPFTVATGLIGGLCYLGAAASIYLDDVKYARMDYRFKAHIFTLTGLQCAVLSTLSPANLSLPSFVICGAVDLISSFYNTLQSCYMRSSFEGWLKDKVFELDILRNSGQNVDALLKDIEDRLAVNYPTSNKENVEAILSKYNLQNELLMYLDRATPGQIANDQRIKDEMNNEIANCIATFVARLGTFLGFLFLQTAIASLQPYVIPLLIVGATWYGARTAYAAYKSGFFSCTTQGISQEYQRHEDEQDSTLVPTA